MERCFTVPSEVLGEIDELFSSEKVMNEKFDNRTVLVKIVGNVRLLARQGIPLRGNWKEDKKCEEDSNFYQLFKLRRLRSELLNPKFGSQKSAFL